jgi:DNA-binding LacI/PurR family transcriptional regulator
MRDVAERAGVSNTTVSFVLNGRMDFSIPDTTRERILKAAAELGYRRNGIARSLARGKSQLAGVLVPGLEESFTAEIVNGIQEAADALDYRMLLSFSRRSEEEEARQARLLLDHRVDGLVCVANAATVGGTEGWLTDALRQGVACVVVDDEVPGQPVDHVVTDDRTGAMAAVRHLVELGHRRIAHLSGDRGSSTARERSSAYRAALAAAGIPVEESLIVGDSFSPSSAAAATRMLLELPDPPTAIFAANDHLAAMAIEVARARGVSAPGEPAVVGFGDLSCLWELELTTVHQPAREMGRLAMERLLHRLEEPDLPAQGIVVPTHLVYRESCGMLQSLRQTRNAGAFAPKGSTLQ